MNPFEHISKEAYLAQRFHRFGISNGELIENEVWKAAVRAGWDAWHIAVKYGDEGRPKQPRWCFARTGMSLTRLTGQTKPIRLVWIGGEHEDYYDPDFLIYNEVVVTGLDGSVKIYGYPEDIFPPTDFHTATFVPESAREGFIYIVGRTGYRDARYPGHTPVFRLDLNDMSISEIILRGEQPSWLYGHHAAYLPARHSIVLWGGTILQTKEVAVENTEIWMIDLDKREWLRSPELDLREITLLGEAKCG